MSIIKHVTGNGATLLFFKVLDLAYGCTDSYMTTQIFEIDGLIPYTLEVGGPLSYLWHTGAAL